MQQKTAEIQNRKYELASEYKYDELVEFMEEVNKNDPNECPVGLAIALALSGDTTERPMRLMEQVLEDKSLSKKASATAHALMCFLYQRYGLTEKAEKLARSLPHARESRELLLPHFLGKKKREDYLRENLPRILNAICSLIDGDFMTNDEQLHSIEFGTYVKPFDPADAVKKIAEFFEVN